MKPPSRAKSGSSAASAPAEAVDQHAMFAQFHDRLTQQPFGCRFRPGRQQRLEARRDRKSVAQAGQIARSAAAERQPRQRPRHVRAFLQQRAQILAQPLLAHEELDQVEPGVDRLRIGQRPGQIGRQAPRAGPGHGPVDRGEQAAAPLARQRLDQFQIAPGRGIDLHDRADAQAARLAELGQFAALGQVDIFDEGAAGSAFRTAEGAEPVQRADAIELGQALAAGFAVEAGIGLRRQHGTPFGQQLEEFGLLQQPVAQQQLARLKPCQGRTEPRPG